MFTDKMTVAERIAALKNIFNDFGIPVLPNSVLEQAIKDEFGRGKRSNLNKILLELNQGTDAAKLAANIGAELKKHKDPQVLLVANVFQQWLPSLLGIIDMQHSIDKREKLLSKLLEHFNTKLPSNVHTDRLLRMLVAAQKNLSTNLQIQSVANVTENIGASLNISDLKRFGRIFHEVTPALLALHQAAYPLEQKINHCVNAIRALAIELRSSKLQMSANILDNVHWLAQVTLPQVPEQATVEQALQNLGVSLGHISTKIIQTKAAQAGLTAKEITQLLYASKPFIQIHTNEKELLARTHENQQYAAACAYVAKLAYDIKQDDLARIAVAGVCLASLRQTYYEVKTDNLLAPNFTESLGTILASVGAITKNDTLIQIGNSIVNGVITYSGIMAVPGGATIAVPLAVCSVLTKLFLSSEPKKDHGNKLNTADVLNNLLKQVLVLRQQLKHEFAHLYQKLYQLNQQVLIAIDNGFENLGNLVQYNNTKILENMRTLENKLQDLQLHMHREFIDLYLEYIHDPLEELDYINKYDCYDQVKIDKNKHKLVMWMLYKAKHPNVNGAKLQIDNLSNICSKLNDSEGILSLINKYVNLHFDQQLPEDLPHISTWVLAANTYAWVSAKYPDTLSNIDEAKILTDVLKVGEKTVSFVEQLASNIALWRKFENSLRQIYLQLQERWLQLNLQFSSIYLQSFSNLKQSCQQQAPLFARSSSVGQLEQFTGIDVDINTIWHKYLIKHIPAECLSAINYDLGKLNVVFTVDQNVNKFHTVYIPSGNNILPDDSRDVLFKIEVYYKSQQEKSYLLTTTWFTYDLHNARNRLEQYYKVKFSLRHGNYDWISLDGRSNRVTGHGDTPTHKLIDHNRVAQIYQQWLYNAEHINNPAILQRVKQNNEFMQQNAFLLSQPDCTLLHTENIVLLQIDLHKQLLTHMLKQRSICARILQEDPIIAAGLEKIDLYCNILAVYMRILNIDYTFDLHTKKFSKLIDQLQSPEACHEDLLIKFNDLFTSSDLNICPDKEYLQSEFYVKMQAAISRISLLRANLITERSHLMARL